MSDGIGRRDTLKLASAAAALGAGLGVVLKASDALAGDTTVKAAPGTGVMAAQSKPILISSTQQVKINGYQQIKAERGQMQIKLSTAGGQLLYAATLPDEIAQLLLSAPGGQLQVKLFRAVPQGEALVAEPFREGLMHFVPTTAAPPAAPAAALPAVQK